MADKDDALYRQYLTELEELEKFRITYTSTYRDAPLDREDPDVRRLIEALAMFTARTRHAAKRSLDRATARVFRQHFPHLLSPLPALSMLAVQLDLGHFKDAVELPRGLEVAFVSKPNPAAIHGERPREVFFKTLHPLRLLPLQIDQVDVIRRSGDGRRLVIELSAPHECEERVSELNLYINHLNDFVSSLTVRYMLREHLERVLVVWDDDVDEDTTGRPCRFSFGAPQLPASTLESYEHPLYNARTFLHCPEQDLYLNLEITGQPAKWRRLALCLDLGPDWPAALRLGAGTFHLNVTPIANIRKDMAVPIDYDGMRDRYAVRHPETAARFAVHSVAGMYEMGEQGLTPLRPGVLERDARSYDLEFEGRGEARRCFSALDIPGAFDEPVRVVAEAYWYQPALIDRELSRPDLYDVGFTHRYIEGARLACLGAPVQPRDNALDARQDGLLRLLSIKNHRFLSLEDLKFLLDALAVSSARHFEDIERSIKHLEVQPKPFGSLATKSTGFKYVYRLTLDEQNAANLPLVDLFCAKLFEILAAWSVEEVLQLEVLLPKLDRTLSYPV